MKKLFALALVVLGLAACQTKPEGFDVSTGGEIETLINITIPESATRAAGTNSAEGAFVNGVLDSDEYTMRYILQIYTADGNPSNERLVAYSDGKSVVFPVRLIAGRDYKFVAWADIVKGENDVDFHYNTTDLKSITLNSTWVAMDESRDAFTASVDVLNYSKHSSLDITLRRPFAKLRVVTTDIEAVRNLNVEPTTAKVTYKTAHRDTFNAYEGKAATGSLNKEHNYTIESYGETNNSLTLFTDYFFAENDVTKFDFAVYDQNGEVIIEESFNTDIYVERNYLTTLKGNILTDDGNVIVTIEDAFEIPENEYNPNDIKSTFDLQQAINNAQDGINTIITLSENIDNGTFPIIVPENKIITLNLNDKTIAGEVERASSIILNKGTLTVSNGTISSKATNGGSTVVNNGSFTLIDMTVNGAPSDTATGTASYAVNSKGVGSTLVVNNAEITGRGAIGATEGTKVEINGGTYHTPEAAWGHAIYAVDEGTEVVINGGTFSEGYAMSGNNYGMYQIYSGNKAKTIVNGGNFEPWDCANGFDLCTANDGTIEIYGGFFAEDPTNQGGNNYAATGYISIKISDELYTVMKGSVENGINTYIIENTSDIITLSDIVKRGYTFAGDIVMLGHDIDYAGQTIHPIGYTGSRGPKVFEGTFDGAGHTIRNINQQDMSGAYTQPVGLFAKVNNATFKNLVVEDFTMATYGSEAGTIATWATGDCTFENIEVNNGDVVAYNCETGGILGWAETGNFTFKDIKIGSDVTLCSLWDSYDTPVGGIIGGIGSSSGYSMSVNIENATVACKVDVYNDICSNYQWGAYRRAGMIIGNIRKTQSLNGTTYPNPADENITCSNVTVIYDDWMHYHYCEFKSNGHGSYDDEFTWKHTRVEASDWGSDGIDLRDCNHESFESHNLRYTFDQLFGGGQGVYGLTEYPGVTVNYPKSYQPVKDKTGLKEAMSNGGTVVLISDIDMDTEQLKIEKDIVLDLNGNTLSTSMAYGGISIKDGGSIKNGTIKHKSTVAAIKAFNVGTIENVTIETTCTTPNKTITAIAVQQGGYVGSIKDVTIEGTSQGIEVGYQATVDNIENVTVDMKTNGTANGIGMVINGGKVGKAKDCTFNGEKYGITMHLKGIFDVGLELANCKVTGTDASIYAWDEKSVSNTSGSLTFTYDAATTLNGTFIWDFENECESVVTLNKPE